jgi:hypothetical protein
MTYRHVLSRRTLLRGAGTVAIGLPFLEEMRVRSVYAAPAPAPHRAITLFFGEGMPNHCQEDFLGALNGPLEPLKRHQKKLSFVRGLGFPQMGGAHEAGALCSFNGERFRSKDRAGGPSIDQVMLRELYKGGLPAGMIPTLAMGFYGSYRTQEGHWRRVRSWKDDGSPSEIPKAFPSDLFRRVFGAATPGAPVDTAAAEKQARRRRSVLDSVVGQYKHLTSDAGNLSLESRAKIRTHLERLAELEQRAFAPAMMPAGAASCKKPSNVTDPPLYKGQRSFNGVDLDVNDISAHWRLNVDIFTLAFQCDMTRFGSANFLNTGDRIDVRGRYEYEGRLIYEFNDSRDRPGAGEGERVNHEHFHAWDRRGNRIAPHHMHFHMREVSYFLSKLDDPQWKDADGGTLLDNAMVMITTELSEPGAHSVTGVVHMLGPCGGRVKTNGEVFRVGDGRRPAADLYNTVLRTYGVGRTMASTQFKGEVNEVKLAVKA